MNSFERSETPELAVDSLELESTPKEIVTACLEAAWQVHNQLGETGEELVEKNQFGETALRVDIECEQAVLDALRQMGIPIRVVSEEHGQVDVMENSRYLGVLDGLDGTGVYKEKRGQGRYGTMFGIFEGTDPTYDDYLASGIMEHSTGRLFIATKGGGAFVTENGATEPIHTSGKTELDPQLRIWIDTAYQITNKTFTKPVRPFKPFWEGPLTSGSLAVHHADVASGAADLAFECTRKGVLEEAVSYGLITEAGGAIVDVNGESLAGKKYLKYGQNEKIPLIIAATPELARGVVEHLHSNFEFYRAGYFANFIRQNIDDYKFITQKKFGLYPKPKVKIPGEPGIYVRNRARGDEEDRRNIINHGAIQADALVDLATQLGCSDQEIEDLKRTALIHDFDKLNERSKDKGKKVEGQTNEAIVEAEKESEDKLREAGYSETVIKIFGAIGHNNMHKLKDPECTLAEKLMFLIDAATNDEVIIGARVKTNIMRGRNKEIEKAGDYDKLDEATDIVEREVIKVLGDPTVQTADNLYKWINDRMAARIMAWGAANLEGNPNSEQ